MQMFKLALYAVMFMACIGIVSAVNIAACDYRINTAGDYTLAADISGGSNCINITTSDVNIDCNNKRITYGTVTTYTGANGIAVKNVTGIKNVTIKNCVIVRNSNLLPNHYGLWIENVSNAIVQNNTIRTNGTTLNYGIFLQNVTNVTMQQNTIFTKGNGITNVGIYANKNVSYSNITGNYIYATNGTGTNYGIYLGGIHYEPSIGNIIEGNNISTNSTGASNYGIFINGRVNDTIISGNNITTNGTTLNHGIYGLGIVTAQAGNNLITGNTIITKGTGITNNGIHLTTAFYGTNITNNIIVANGTTTTYGINLIGVASNGTINNSYINNNNITVIAPGTSNVGMSLNSNCYSNNVSYNNVTTWGTTANIGLQVIGVAALPVSYNYVGYNNILNNNSLAAAATSYGMQLSAMAHNNTVEYNNITSLGFTTNYGLYMLDAATTPSNFNIVSNNNITVSGKGATNYGLYATNTFYNNNITDNNITVRGLTGNIGIYILGVADAAGASVARNNIHRNRININGTTTCYGLYFSTNFQYNYAYNNTVFANCSTTPTGIYLLGAAAGNSDFNIIDGNYIVSRGINATSSGYGALISSGVNENVFSNNYINVTGATASYGIQLLSTSALDSAFNVIYNNTVLVNTTSTLTSATNYGVLLSTNPTENIIDSNNIYITGNVTTYGIHATGASYPVLKNTISNNVIVVRNHSWQGNTLIGIYLLTNANQNIVENNNISVIGRNQNYAIRADVSSDNEFTNNTMSADGFDNTSAAVYLVGNSQGNIFENNIITKANGHGVQWILSGYLPKANIFKNNTISGVLRSDWFFLSAYINDNQFINQPILTMNFTGRGVNGTVFEDTRYGKIKFTNYINKSMINVSSQIKLADNFAFVNSTNQTPTVITGTSLNKSAIVTLYNIPVFVNPTVYRDNIECSPSICGALQALGDNVYEFTVTQWSNYTILNKVILFPYSCSLPNVTTFLTTQSICDILNKTRNSLLNNTIYMSMATFNESALPCSMDISETVLSTDLMCDLLRYSKKTLHDLSVANITYANFSYVDGNKTTTGQATSYNYVS